MKIIFLDFDRVMETTQRAIAILNQKNVETT